MRVGRAWRPSGVRRTVAAQCRPCVERGDWHRGCSSGIEAGIEAIDWRHDSSRRLEPAPAPVRLPRRRSRPACGRPRAPVRPSRATTRMVSSPAMVPTTSARLARSMAEARNCAAPGGVRSTARLPDPSKDSSSSPEQPGQPVGAALHRPRAAVLGDPVDRRAAVHAAEFERAEFLQVPGQGGLGDLDARTPQQRHQFGLRPDDRGRGSGR